MAFLDDVKSGDVEGVRKRLAEEPALASYKENGSSAMCLAVFYGHPEVAEAIAASGHTPDLFEAAATGRAERVAEILKESPQAVDAFGDDGFHALGLACAFGHADVVGVLLNAGASMTLETKNPNVRVAPIHSAAFGGNSVIMKLLLDHGADPNLRGEGGFVALHTAAENGDLEMARLLLDGGADKSVATDDGRTPASIASAAGHEDLSKLLSTE